MSDTLSSAATGYGAGWAKRRAVHGPTGSSPAARPARSFQAVMEERVYHDAMTGCWLFYGSNSSAYPIIRLNGHRTNAHRFSFEHHFGPVPEGLFVCHRCDTPACVNPDHLFAGTPRENSLDMHRKGRGHDLTQYKHPWPRNISAKLSAADIGPICDLYRAGLSSSVIAERYSVGRSTITAILAGQTWADVDVERPRVGATRATGRNRRTGYTRRSRK